MKRYIVKQESEVDCGACALLSIIKYYNGYVPLEIIKVDTLTNNYGTNFYNLKLGATGYGFDVKGVKSSSLDNIHLPCIVQILVSNFSHFVSVYKYGAKVSIIDPSKGIVEMTKDQFDKVYTGYALEFIPNSKVIKYNDERKFVYLLKNTLLTYKKLLFILIIISIPIIILTLLSSLNIIFIFQNNLVMLAISIIIFNIILSYLKNITMSHLNRKINIDVISNYLKHIFNLPLKYLQLKKVGELSNKINDLYNIKDLFTHLLVNVILNFILLLGAFVILIILNFHLSLIILIFSIIYLLIMYFISKDIYRMVSDIMLSDNLFMDKVIEYLTKIKTIKNLNIEYFVSKLKDSLDNTIKNKFSLDKKYNILDFFESLIEQLLFVGILIYSFYQRLEYINIIVFITVYNYFLQSLKYFINLFPSLMYFKSVFNRIGSLFDLEIDELESFSEENKLIVTDLSYSHNKLEYIIKNWNLNINKGEKVLITGLNGSGKSTLLDIIAGNIKDYEGEVRHNGRLSYLDQGADLFSDSIMNNIILAEKYDDNRFKKVEKITCLSEIIENKPSGYHTHIYSSNISGGEKQRILLARSLYQDFDILLLDESLSQVADNERLKILHNLFKNYKNEIILYVTHHNDDIKYDKTINLTARKDNYVNSK